MRPALHLIATALFIAIMGTTCRADDTATPVDPIRKHLDNAKTIDAKARQQAADALRSACDTAMKSAALEQAAEIKLEELDFTSKGTLPSSPELKQAIADYEEAVDLADAKLDRAFSRAVRAYISQGDNQKALAVEHEKSSVHLQHSPNDDAIAKQDAGTPAAIAQTLQQAKNQYKTDVDQAAKVLSDKVDARLNGAMNAGDLQSAKSLQAIQKAIKADGPIPEYVTDKEVTAAKTTYQHAIQNANITMARAYSQAVSSFTRARQLDQAETVQTEFTTSTLSSIDLKTADDPSSAPSDTTWILGRNLPEFLTTSDRWDIHPHGGIFLPKRVFIRSRNGDFLNRDFTCDIWFTVESTGTNLFIGVGEGRGRPADELPLNSMALCIASPDLNKGATGFLRPDGQIDTIGHLTNAGDYVARLERTGNILAMAIGEEDADGAFNPKIATTISDTKVFAPFMTTKNAHIFFGGGRFSKLRFINGKPPAIVPDAPVKAILREAH